MWSKERIHQLSEFDSIQKQRMELDLLLSNELSYTLAEEFGARIIADKGYAVDAISSGTISRFHYDLDLIAVCNMNTSPENFYLSFHNNLERISGFPWEADPQERRSWYKFYEYGKKRRIADISEDQDISLAQKIDLHVLYSTNPFEKETQISINGKHNKNYIMGLYKTIINSPSGKKYLIEVPNCNELIASKIRLIESYIPHINPSLRESDLYDFQLLFNSSGFDIQEVLEIIKKYYIDTQHIFEHQGLQKSINALLQLNYDIIPNSLIQYVKMLPTEPNN